MSSPVSKFTIFSDYIPTPIMRATSTIRLKVYETYIGAIKFLVDAIRKYISSNLAGVTGMLLSEPHVIIKSIYQTYRKKPIEEQDEIFLRTNNCTRPVLLLPGAIKDTRYLSEFTESLKKEQLKVFTLVTTGDNAKDKQAILNKIEEICQKCVVDRVDLVGHSIGSQLAVYSAFTDETVQINEQGELQAREGMKPTIDERIGKIVKIAYPSDQNELHLVQQADKENCLYNINAKYDVLMGHKPCAIKQTYNVNNYPCGHIGAAYDKQVSARVGHILKYYHDF